MKHPIPSAALDDRLGFIGTSGSGKTYNAGGAVERLLDRRARAVIVDPLGVWWGLRLLADGKTQSPYDVAIFGGPHGDLPLNEHAGALIGETAATMAESCIVDLSQLGTKSSERRFMTAFLETIYRKASGEPFHLIVDEADLFAPQKPPKGDETLLNLMEQIVRRGRVKGFIPWLISQRPAVLNKNVLSQVDGLIAFKLTASQDRDALDGWIEGQADKAQGKAIKDALPAMQVGQGVVWVPGRGVLDTVAFPAKVSFDSSRTPKRGEKAKRTAALKPLDLGALKARLSTVEAETKANDPKALRAEIAKLKVEAAKKQPAPIREFAVDQSALDFAKRAGEAIGLSRGKIEGYGQALKDVSTLHRALMKSVGGLETSIGNIKQAAASMEAWLAKLAERQEEAKKDTKQETVKSGPPAEQRPRTPPSSRPAPPTRATPSPGAAGDGTSLTNPQRELLRSCAWWRAMGHDTPSRTQVAAIAGWKPKGSNLRNRLTELSSAGLIEYAQPSSVRLTEDGIAAAPEPDTRQSLIESIRSVCTQPMLTIFDALLDLRNEGIVEADRADIAYRVGWEPGGSNLRNRLTELSSIEAIDYPSRGMVRIQEWVVEQMAVAA